MTNKLTFLTDKNNVVTNTVIVAKQFNKKHKNVLQTAKKLAAENSAAAKMFIESTYVDDNYHVQPMIIMNRDGFSLLAMGFTGKEALKFKLDFIDQFNTMETAIEKQHVELPSTPQAMTKALLENMDANNEDIKTIKRDVNKLQNTMRINGNQEKALLDIHHKSAFKALGGKESNAYKNRKLRDKTFRSVWSEFKQAFYLPRYGELQQVRFDDGKEFLESWQPNTELRLEIKKANGQGTLF